MRIASPTVRIGQRSAFWGLMAALVLFCSEPRASGNVITYEFDATVTDVASSQSPFPLAIQIGMPVSGFFSYDTSVPRDAYNNVDVGVTLEVRIGSYVWRDEHAGAGVEPFLVYAGNPGWASGSQVSFAGNAVGTEIHFETKPAILADGSLPEDLSRFDHRWGSVSSPYKGPDAPYFAVDFGNIRTTRVCDSGSSFMLSGFACFGIFLFQRTRRQREAL